MTKTTTALLALCAMPFAALAQFPHFNSITLSRAPLAGAALPAFANRITDSMIMVGSQTVPTPSGFGFDAQLNHAVIWTVANGTQELTLPPALGLNGGYPAEWRGVDVNESGQALISYTFSNQPPRVFVRPAAGGTWTEYTVTNMPGVTRWNAMGITDSGQVIGVAQNTSAGTNTPIRWTSTTTAVAVPLPANPAPAVNPTPQIVHIAPSGWMLLSYQPAGGGLTAVYAVNPANQVDHLFPLPAGYNRGAPVRINRAGVAIGSVNVLGQLPSHATLWDTTGATTDLYGGAADFGIGSANNDAGWATGESNYNSDKKLFLPGLGATSLGGLINPGQLPVGASLTGVGVLNNNGQIMATVTGGQAVLLTPDNACPVVSLNPPAALTQCNNGTFTLSAAGYAAQAVQYQWRRASQPIPGANSATYTFTNRLPTDSGLYDCVLSTPCGNAVTTPCNVRLYVTCGPADIGATGGVYSSCGDGYLDNNDFIAFIDLFFAGNPIADRGTVGGIPGSDGQFDNNDFIVFIDQFFTGC